MKKILMLFAAAALMFAACNPKEQPKDPSKDPSKDAPVSADPSVDPGKTEEKLSVDLTRRNFDIAGDFDYDIAIDGKTATIQLAYADKDEAQALDIEFIGLPSGVEADYTNPYDYSDGKTQEIVFKKAGSTDESKWDKWTVGVDVAAEIPHFVELSVAGVEITSAEQTIKMAGGTDLSKLVVEYVVSPEGSVVKADGVAIASGAEVDFSDMLNGVVISIEGGEETFTVKIETSGIHKITRVWGKYAKPVTVEDDGWYTNKLGLDWTVKGNWDRNVAIDDKYVYLAATESNAGTAGDYLAKIWAIDINNPDNVKELKIPEGLSAQHKTAGLAIAPDGNGTRLLFCTMAMAAAHKYEIYSYTSPDADPELVASFPYSDIGKRVGDRITFFGTWQDGEICSVSWTDGSAIIIPVVAGKDRKEFFTADLKNGGLTATVGGNGAKLVKYSNDEYIWCGTGNPIVMSRDGNTFTQKLLTTKDQGFGSPIHGFNFFTVKGERYAVFAGRVNSFQSSNVRIFPLSDDSLQTSLMDADPFAKSWKFGLGDPDIEQNETAGYKDANGIADTAVREIGGVTYIVAAGCGSGISLFKAE